MGEKADDSKFKKKKKKKGKQRRRKDFDQRGNSPQENKEPTV